jgi:glutamine synthetase
MAALIAAGIDGIEKKMPLQPAFTGDAYGATDVQEIPGTLRAAMEITNRSHMLRAAFGDDVVDHYVHAARVEQDEYDRRITDWEVARGFERA